MTPCGLKHNNSVPRRFGLSGFPSAPLDFPEKHNYNIRNIVCLQRTGIADKTDITEGFL